MFEKVQKLFDENSVKNCHFIYLKKNGNEFETNSISLGKSHWNNNQDLNGDYIFRLMSMSKPITALAAMQLVESAWTGKYSQVGTCFNAAAFTTISASFTAEQTSE